MHNTRFKYEIDTLTLFIETFCKNKHQNEQSCFTLNLNHNNYKYIKTANLCKECYEILLTTTHHLENCQLEEKPKCRKCKIKCYDKNHWKKVSQIMRYSGIKLGFIKLKNNMFNILKNS